MNRLRQIFSTFVLTAVLATSAFADGQMDTPKAPPPPIPTTPVPVVDETNGDITAAVDPLTEVILNALQSLGMLF